MTNHYDDFSLIDFFSSHALERNDRYFVKKNTAEKRNQGMKILHS